jgi:HAD superfamily hydrolase (TIGR01509 family)
MDGLMLDTQRISIRSWKAAVTECCFTLTDEMVSAIIGRNEEQVNAVLQERLGPEFPVLKCRKLSDDIFEKDVRRGGVPLKPGLMELLAFLDERGVKRAVATSTSHYMADYTLELAKLAKRFEVIITGDDVKRSKPEPDIFLAAAKAMCVEPDRCMVLEDSFNGIRAAHAAGMIPIMVPDLIPPTDLPIRWCRRSGRRRP